MTVWIPWPGGIIEAPTAKMIVLDERETIAWVSEEDYDWVREKIWYPSCLEGAGKKQYAIRKERRGGREAPVNTFYLHLSVLALKCGPKPIIHGSRGRRLKIIGDHINGNSLDCRRENLRYATMSQNNANKFGLAYRQLDFNVAVHHLED